MQGQGFACCVSMLLTRCLLSWIYAVSMAYPNSHSVAVRQLADHYIWRHSPPPRPAGLPLMMFDVQAVTLAGDVRVMKS